MASLELTQEELSLIRMLLRKEEISSRIEINHARRTFEYRDYLRTREKEISMLLDKIKDIMGEEEHSWKE